MGRWAIAVVLAGCGAAPAPAPLAVAPAPLVALPAPPPPAPVAVAPAREVRSDPIDLEAEARWEEERARYLAERQAHRERVLALIEPIAPDLAEHVRDAEDEGYVDARESGGLVVFTTGWYGNGIDAGWESHDHVLTTTGERLLTLHAEGIDGALSHAVEVAPGLALEAQRDAFRAAIDGDGRWLRSRTDPGAARAHLFLSVRERPARVEGAGVTVVGPLYLAPLEVRGPPEGDPCPAREPTAPHGPTAWGDALYLDPRIFAGTAVGIPLAWEGDYVDDDEEPREVARERERRARPAMIRVAPVARCAEIARFGDVEVRVHELPGRNRGAAVVLHDLRTRTHRWVLETRHAVLGSRIDWLGAESGVVLGMYESEHPGEIYAGHGGIVAIRVRDGATFRIDVPDAFEGDEGVTHWSERDDEVDEQERCIEARAQALGTDEISDADREACRPPRRIVAEIRDHALRALREDGTWAGIDLARLGALVDRGALSDQAGAITIAPSAGSIESERTPPR